MKKILYIYTVLLTALMVGFTSCDDYFDVRPQSETILEDFWKNESDVKSAVGGCYRAMLEEGFLKRMIVWGEVRSDNVLAGSNILADDDDARALNRILTLSLTGDNTYTYWGEIYAVINNCNSVIHYAPSVQLKDPNFTTVQLNTYISEAKAIRSLCYFALLRTFRDIPLVTEPTIDDSKSFEVFQAEPDSIIDFMIKDLKSVENVAMTTFKNNEGYNRGRITQKAIWALLADIYLWKNDYENCVTYCDKILNSADYRTDLTLMPSATYNNQVFLNGNSKESIFELQFDYQTRSDVLYKFYSYESTPNVSTVYLLSSYDFESSRNALFTSSDLRAKNSGYYPSNVPDDGYYSIMKYVYGRSGLSTSKNDYFSSYGTYPHWILYRLPDVYLMKAEALVEIGGDTNLEAAYELVKLTYDRANPDKMLPDEYGSPYDSQSAMRNFVFDERQREFLFEGKRYFDLVRRINREGSTTYVVNNYLVRKYPKIDALTVRTKLASINAFYMPINNGERKLNPNLDQNPYYDTSGNISKN